MSDGVSMQPPAEPAEEQGQGQEQGQEPEQAPPAPTRVMLRRAPRFGPIILSGAALGGLISFVVVLLTPGSDGQLTDRLTNQFTDRAVLGYFAVLGLLLGGIVGAVLAVLADRRR